MIVFSIVDIAETQTIPLPSALQKVPELAHPMITGLTVSWE
jgi:hypothetical protein